VSPDLARYRRSGGVLYRRVHDVVLLLAPGERQVFALSGAGPDLWELLAEPISVRDAVHRLAADYSVPAETIAPDVRRVFAELAEMDVVTRAEA
jgi:hypothetical protein